MAKPNDKESLYNTKHLSVIFGIISLILLGVIVWMVLDDHSREWKSYQRSFRQMEFEKTQADIKKAAGKVNINELGRLKAGLEAKEKELSSKKKLLASKLATQHNVAVRLQKAAQNYQVEKSYFEAVRYAYESAAMEKDEHLVQMKTSHELRKKELANDLDTWQKKVNQSQTVVDELTKEKEKIDAEIAGFTQEHDVLAQKISAMSAEEKRLSKNLEALKPGWFNMLRNSPIFDFMAPTYKVRQLVMEDLYDDYNFVRVPKVDRCITCHTAIDVKGFENAPQPFRTHPDLDTYLGSASPHPLDQFACTVCHGGNGQALTFYHTGHTPDSEEEAHAWGKKYGWEPVHHWEDPMLAMKDIQASCMKCHQGVMSIPEAPKVNEGRRLFEQLGCWGCHKVAGIASLRKVGPDLTQLRGKVDPAWTSKWIRAPHSFRPDTKMPQFFGLSNALSREEEDVEAAAIGAYLYHHSAEFTPDEIKAKGDAATGEDLVKKVGCLGCHGLDNIKVNEFAPDLSAIGSKVSLAWLADWLKNPKHYWPETHMPSLRLTDQEAADIAAYLLSKKNARFDAMSELEPDKQILDNLVQEELRESYTKGEAEAKLKAMSADEKGVYLGERLITFYGCYACHDIKGFESAKEIGTELTEEGSKVISQFDFGFLHDLPHTRQAFFDQKLKNPRAFDKGRVRTRKEKLKMPKFNLTDEERAALVTYLTGLKREYIPLSKQVVPDERMKMEEAGKRIIRDHNCAGCHEVDRGIGGNIAKLVEDPGMAPPSIVGQGKRTQDKWLFEFIKNPTPVRPWLHFRMPTFGFTDDQLDTLVKGFRAEDHVPLTFQDPSAHPTEKSLADGDKLFNMFQCIKCHTASAPKEGAAMSASELAPNLTLARDRLRHEWIVDWLKDPEALMPGTRMPGYFPDMQSPAPDILEGDAAKQMVALRDYVVSLGDEQKEKGELE